MKPTTEKRMALYELLTTAELKPVIAAMTQRLNMLQSELAAANKVLRNRSKNKGPKE